jgi:putative hydrolase of the HAD superfamily
MSQSLNYGHSLSPDWDNVDCVFLDMDGTLLDLNYDNRVWNELVPQAFAAHQGLTLQEAKDKLLTHMREIHGTIEYYSFEYWSAFTDVDLIAEHKHAVELLAYRPGALEFLRWLKANGCPTVIATNAHRSSIRVKDHQINISAEVDAVVSSQDYHSPKEADHFWQALLADHAYTPSRCVFVDDNIPVLDAAARNKIGILYAIATPDSQQASRADLGYPTFDHFAEICPAIAQTTDTQGRA